MKSAPPMVSITEDDPAVCEGLQLILERAGYDTLIASDARQLMLPGATLPDLYILDRQLAGMDGLEVCRFLKSQPATASIPVLMISATPHVSRLASDAMADAFLEKPFRASALLELIRKYIHKR